MAVIAAGAVITLVVDQLQIVRWGGSRDIELTVLSHRPVKIVSFAKYGREEDAEHIATIGLGFLEHGWPPFEPADRSPEGAFVIPVMTHGRETLLGIGDSWGQQRKMLFLVETEGGGHWVAVLLLPDVTKADRAVLRIPDDARPVRPAALKPGAVVH